MREKHKKKRFIVQWIHENAFCFHSEYFESAGALKGKRLAHLIKFDSLLCSHFFDSKKSELKAKQQVFALCLPVNHKND